MRFADYISLGFRSLRRSRLRSGLTISALLVGATGVTIMLTFVTSVKNYISNQFVQTGQVRQIIVAENPDLTYDPAGGGFEGGPLAQAPNGNGSTPAAVMTPALEAKIAAIPHVVGVSATLQTGPDGGIRYISLGSKQLQPHFVGYQPDGVMNPTLEAGRDLQATDTSGVMLVSQDYADALGFKGRYAGLVGQTVDMTTMRGYTGVGAVLPSKLPAGNQCGPNERRPGACGPQATINPVVLHARVVGVTSEMFQRQTLFIPLSWMVAISDQARTQDVQQPPRSVPQQRCGPGACPAGGGLQCQPGQPCGPPPSGEMTVRWTRDSPKQYILDSGGFQSMLVNIDTIQDVTPAANAIGRLGVHAATGIAALNKQKTKANTLGAVLGALGLIALGIAALGVTNTMVMSVLERTREIGVMRALGARRSTIRRLFAFEAASLGFFGGLFGVIIGYVFVLVAKPIIGRAVTSGKLVGANFSVPIWLVVLVIAGTTAIGFLSGLLPARRAARLDPVEALRYE